MDDRPLEIVLAEDNAADAKLVDMALRRQGMPYHLHVCTDGEQALDYLHARGPFHDAPRPDLIVLDLNLPCYDGREILMRLHGIGELRDVPVAVFTSSDSPRDIDEARRCGATAYVTKPHDLQEFLAVGEVLRDLAAAHVERHG